MTKPQLIIAVEKLIKDSLALSNEKKKAWIETMKTWPLYGLEQAIHILSENNRSMDSAIEKTLLEDTDGKQMAMLTNIKNSTKRNSLQLQEKTSTQEENPDEFLNQSLNQT